MLKADLIGVGIIGAGRAGQVHAGNFAAHVPEARLISLFDLNEDSLREAGSKWGVSTYTDLERFLQDPSLDAVVIAAPTPAHARLVQAAAEAGKAILCEKPLALNEEDVAVMAEAVKKNSVIFVMAFMRRFAQSFIRAKELIERGDIGEPLVVKSVGKGPGLPPRWAWDIAQSNGVLGEVNSHDFDCLRFLTGEEYRWIFAAGRNNKCPDLAAEFPDFYDTVVVCCGMTGKVIGTIDGACPVGYGYDARVEIQGSEGVLFIGNLAKDGIIVGTRSGGVSKEIVDSWRSLFWEAYLAEDRHLIDCLQNKCSPKSTLEDGWKALQAVVAANRSIRSGQVETL